MSVIFDALNKLDKEKRTRKTGMLIVGAPSLSGRRGAAGARLSGTAALALVLLGAAGWWWTRDAPSTGPAPPPPPTRQTAATREAARSRPTPTGDSAPVRPSDLAVIPAAPATDASEAGPDTAAEPAAEPAASELAPRPEPAQLQLEAITLRDNGPVAIVSGRLVREGDVFDGIRVVRIGQTEVELFVQAEERTLVLRF